jgi:hypothetical protein
MLFAFKQRLVEAGLTNDALESPASEGIVKRYGDGNGCTFCLQLHNSVTATLANGEKATPFKYPASLST